MRFFIVTAEIVEQWQGKRTGSKGLFFRQDNLGRWVINVEVERLWPAINWKDFEQVELTVNDFPTTEND